MMFLNIDIWLKHPKAILISTIALLIAGGWMATGLAIEWAPVVELPTIALIANWPGASPRHLERHVTAPLERILAGIPGTANVESYSREGQAHLRIEVSEKRKLDIYMAELSDHLVALRGSLPENVNPRVSLEVPESLKNEQGFMTLQLIGDISPEALRRFAEEIVAPRLRSLAGISTVTIEGGEERELLVAVNVDRLFAYHISADSIGQRLADTFLARSYGWLFGSGSRSLLWKPGEKEFTAVPELALAGNSTTASLVQLADVAQISLNPAPVRTISRVTGEPVVTLILDRAPGTNLLTLAAEVRSTLGRLHKEIPWGVEALVVEDRSEDVRREFRDIAVRAGLGLLGLLAVLLARLRSGRAVAIVVFTVTAALALGLALLRPLGMTLNVLTFAGLALLVGLLVDNATVVVHQFLTGGVDLTVQGAVEYARFAARAVRAVWLPLLGGTLSTLAVFLPMVYLSGELRFLFAPFAVLAALTLGFSLLTTALLVPVLGHYLPRNSSLSGHHRSPRKYGLRWFSLTLCCLASRFPVATLLLLILAVGLPMPLLPEHFQEPGSGWDSQEKKRRAERYNATLGSDMVRNLREWLDPVLGGVTRPFLEEVELDRPWDFDERPVLTVWLKLPTGSGIERADELIRRFEQRALEQKALGHTLTRVTEDIAVLRVLFEDDAMSTGEPFAMRQELISQALQIAGMEVAVSGLVPIGFYSGLGNVSGYMVEAYGPSYERLKEVTSAFSRRVETHRRVADIDISAGRHGQEEAREVLTLGWREVATAKTRMTAHDLTAMLGSHLLTRRPIFYAALVGQARMPVRLITAGAEDLELTDFLHRPLAGRTGTMLHLAGLVEFSAEKQPPTIYRFNQQYKRYIRIYYRGPFRLGKKMLDREIEAMPLPPGYLLKQPTWLAFGEEVQKEFLWLVFGTIALVFLILAAVFESWRLPWVVMLSVPLAFIGVALGFLWSGIDYTEGAFIGLVLLVGIAVNDSILLVYRYRQLRELRPTTNPALMARLAVRHRLRPMWTTTMTSVVGMLPLLLFPKQGFFWLGLAITVVGGLLSSTLLAPLATVAILSLKREEAPSLIAVARPK
ncbi:MAG: efflux RND transporter permease subunit [bacterium]|nr:efflux RND transporter permease subunit [bacterium]